MDTYLSQSAPTSIYASATTLRIDGDDPPGMGRDLEPLLKWDISSIPSGRVVQSASITLQISNASSETYDLYALLRPWTTSATWNRATSTVSWQVAGAAGPQDRGAIVLGTISAPKNTSVTIALNSAGIAVVQGWVNNPSSNYGLIAARSASTDGLFFVSNEGTKPGQHPRLVVTYR